MVRRRVLVTGASSGIGRATALHLAGRGDSVVLVSRSGETLEQVRRECADLGAEAVVCAADVTDARALSAAFDEGERRLGGLDAVVHSVAVLTYGRFADVPAEVFDRAVSTNLLGTANVAREALRRFGPDSPGDVVVLGSLLGKISVPYMTGYVSSKWGVHGLVRGLQLEARGREGITFSLVSPGGVDTPAYRQAGTFGSPHGKPPPPVDPPEKVARAVVRALDRPRRETSVGLANGIDLLGFRLLPAVYDLLVTPLMERAGLTGPVAPDSAGNVLEPRPEREAVHGGFRRSWRALAGQAVRTVRGAA